MALLSGCANSPAAMLLQRFEYSRLCMGVNTRMVLFLPSETQAIDAAAAAFERIGQLDAVMSDYRRDSELNRLCENAGDGPVKVSGDLFRVLQASLASSRCSDGTFDPTVGPLVALWRTSRQTHVLPHESELVEARERVGWQNIVLNNSDHTITLLKPRMQLDLGGIGKGYAAQQAVDLLKSRGVNRCMVALAGDIVVGDAPPDTDGWRIEIASRSDVGLQRDPSNSGMLLLKSAAISTSGDASQFIDINGIRYSHIIDPRTGLGVANHVQVTIVAPRGEVADALSSAACVIGTTDGIEQLLGQFPGTAAIIEDFDTSQPHAVIIDPSQRLQWTAEGAHP